MKKVFVEPSMRKIELNLSENIAESGKIVEKGFYFLYHWWECSIQDANVRIDEASLEQMWACYADGSESENLRGRVLVPEEIVRAHLKY